ncbi:MAG TPA: hypothetical protein VN457_00710 [Chlamydiales bacterium]|nr:hypothetical protein [Chlamydiales bacterium]
MKKQKKSRRKNKLQLQKMAATTDDLYETFNEIYIDFIANLYKSFPDVKKLEIECQFLNRAVERFGMNTSKIFNHLEEGVSTLYSHIHAKNVAIFQRAFHKEQRIQFLEVTGLYEIFPRLDDEERDDLWIHLQNLTQHFSLFTGTGKNLDKFTRLAASFIQQNPGIQQQDVQTSIYQQMFTNPQIRNQMCEILTSPDLNSLRGGFGDLVQGLNMVPQQQQQEATTTEAANIELVPTAEEQQLAVARADASQAASAQPDDADAAMSKMFADLEQKDREITTTARNTKEKPPMQSMVDFLKNTEITPSDMKTVHGMAESILGVGAKPEDTAKMQRLFGMVSNGSLQTSEQLTNELKSNFGATQEDLDQVKDFSTQIGQFGSLLKNVAGQGNVFGMGKKG